MNNTFNYKSDNYDRQAQRFVIPLYIRDELSNFNYSSTATLAKYNTHFYIIFAAHAISKNIKIDDFYFFAADGKFYGLAEMSIGHKVFEADDIVIVDCFNRVLDGKNYFNLNEASLLGFERNHFAWIGFPSSKCKAVKVHNSKTSESLRSEYIHADKEKLYYKSASYLIIESKIVSNNKLRITGIYNRKKANLKYKGAVSMAPHPEGMSGGAMYFFSEDRKLKETLDNTFRFTGIGIEYTRDNRIVGVSRTRIIELLEQFNSEFPLQFIFQPEEYEN
jgi:hypothetical protein